MRARGEVLRRERNARWIADGRVRQGPRVSSSHGWNDS